MSGGDGTEGGDPQEPEPGATSGPAGPPETSPENSDIQRRETDTPPEEPDSPPEEPNPPSTDTRTAARIRELERYEKMIQAAGDPVYTTDPDGAFTFVNDAFVDLTGYDRATLVGTPAEEIVGSEAERAVREALRDLVEADPEGSTTAEFAFESATGETTRVETHVALLPGDDDDRRGALGVVRDVTERTETETALRGERDRLSALFENVPEPVIEYEFRDGEPHVRGVNPAFEATFGYDREAAVGRPIDDLLVPPEYAEEAARLNEQVAAAEHLDAEVTRRTVDGPREFLLRNAPITGEAETVAGYVIYTDITDRKQSERRVHALFEHSTDCIAETEYVDGEPVVRRVNPAFRETFGFDVEEMMGESIDDFVIPDDRREEARRINQRTIEGEPVEQEVRRLTADGEQDFLLRSVPFQVGDTRRDYTVYTDITERKRHERELERTNERLDAFASVVSHDIRNPLLAANGRLELLRESEDLSHADGIEDALDRIEGIVDDVLALAREGRTVTDPETVAVEPLATRCWETIEGPAASLEVEAGDLAVVADSSRLRRLLENLFRNAVEHAGEDVVVTVGALPDGHGFVVADDGPGIPADDRESVFEWGVSTKRGGTGFGLAIVEEIAAAHGWEVTATAAESGGARFEFSGVDVVEQ